MRSLHIIRLALFASALAVGWTAAVRAQDAAPQDEGDSSASSVDARSGDIIVTAERGPNSAATDIPADQVLDATAIASYGASNAAELVSALSVQTRSSRGRGSGFPVILVNGRRVSGFGEIRNLPSEAIARVEIFPEEVAIEYGYSPDQRVVNFILKDDFSAITTEAEGGGATDGGLAQYEAEASLLRLRGRGRLNLTATAGGQSALTEAERAIIQSVGGDGTQRTLAPATNSYALDGTFARPINDQTGASLNLRYDQNLSRSLIGQRVADPAQALRGRSRSETLHAGASSDGRFGAWRWTVTGSYDGGVARSVTDRERALTGPVAQNRTRTETDTADVDAVLAGTLFRLPAGAVRTTAQVGWRYIDLSARSDLSGVVTLSDLSRTAFLGSVNVDLPVASRNDNVLAFLGDLSINGRYALRDVSDFRTLDSWTIGANWSPLDGVSVQLAYVGEENAPSVSRLGAPALLTPLRTIFDFTRGETVLADVITGGNPLLAAETRRDLRIQANWRPLAGRELQLTAAFARTTSRNTTADFPLLTPEIEAAFPGRVSRDMTGRIVSVDQRPVNFARTAGRQLRYGVNFSRPFGQAAGGGPGGRGPFGGGAFGAGRPPGAPARPAPSPSTAPAATPPATATGPAPTPPSPPAATRSAPGAGPTPGGPRGGGRRGGLGAMFGGGQGGRWSIGLFHTIRFEDEVLIRPGVPVLDLLNGSATGASGGSPRHVVEFDGGWFFRGMGIRANGSWTDGSTVIGGPVAGGGTASDLNFSPQMTVNLRLFVDLGQRGTLAERHPVFRNMRLRLGIDNLFNDRQTVRDATGMIPLRYQQGFIDPQGRLVELELRKQF